MSIRAAVDRITWATTQAYDRSGMTLTIHHDLADFAAAKIAARGLPTSPCFQSGDGLWIAGRDRNGDIGHLQAIVFCALRSVHDELTDPSLRYAACDTAEPIVAVDCDLQGEIRGRLAYHGEMWLRPDFRRRNLAGPLGNLAIVSAYAKWRPDLIWGLIIPSRANAGYTTKVVAHRHWGPGVRWLARDGNEVLRESVCWLNGTEIEKTIRALDVTGDRENRAGKILADVH